MVTTTKGRILGAAIVGSHAGELIGMATLAVKKEMTVADFRDLVVAYPTLTETWKRAAVSFYQREPRRPAVGRLLRFLRFFG